LNAPSHDGKAFEIQARGSVNFFLNLKGSTMRLYLTAIVLTAASTAVILSTCIAHSSPAEAAPARIMQLM
jgi:hypothetical protein